MTPQEKIDVLEKAIPLINSQEWGISGICSAIYDVCEAQGIEMEFSGTWDQKAALFISYVLEIKLPPKQFGSEETRNEYCFPITTEGDEQRRQFLRDHIERLKKEL